MANLILPNLVLCMVGGYLCICRMRFISRATKKPIMLRYIMWITAFAASGLSWLFGHPATVFQMLLGLCVIADFSLGFRAWRNGLPAYARA